MSNRNDITGDKIITKNNNENFNKNYDLIFKKDNHDKQAKEEEKRAYFDSLKGNK